MSDNVYKEAWDYAYAELKDEYIKAGQENDFQLWFNMKYVSDTIDAITVSVASEFLRQSMLKKGNFDIVEKKLQKITGQENLKLNPIVLEEKKEEEKPVTTEKPKSEKQNKTESKKEKSPRKKHPNLKEEFTFDNFIPGDNSNFAYKASIEAAKNPGRYKNPILLYGGSGLGKTHLMQAIGNYIYENSEEELKICYITAEDFTNEFTSSFTTKSEEKFKAKYRGYDVLLLDDIHFLFNKQGTQEQLFWTFEALHKKNSQMVFTCDRPISEIKGMTERLVSRLSSGLPVDLNPPDYETRVAILQKKLDLIGKTINPEIIQFIARNIESNVRDLEGALNKTVEYAELIEKEVTIDIAKDLLKDFVSNVNTGNITIDVIQKVICDNYQISLQDIKSKKRDKKFAIPRQIAVYLSRELTEYSYSEIGSEFGGKDHSTIMHSCEKIGDMRKIDPSMDSKIKLFIREIKDYKKQ